MSPWDDTDLDVPTEADFALSREELSLLAKHQVDWRDPKAVVRLCRLVDRLDRRVVDMRERLIKELLVTREEAGHA